MSAPDDDGTLDNLPTKKRRRISFEDTDTWTTSRPADPPPPGSLADWLAKKKESAPAHLGAYADPDRWWLCCDPLPPIPLGDKAATISIGRSDECDVVLPHTQVSRVHGQIKVLGAQRYFYEDHGSSNGSLLNGEKTKTAKLNVGDVLSLGPYEIEIHSSESLQARSRNATDEGDIGGGTRVFEVKPQAAMTGRLSEVPIVEILQTLEFNRKTGTLEIQGSQPGRLVLCEGRPVSASLGELADDEAVVAMADLHEGRFVFSGQVEPGEVRIRATLTHLLLEASRRRDEGA